MVISSILLGGDADILYRILKEDLHHNYPLVFAQREPSPLFCWHLILHCLSDDENPPFYAYLQWNSPILRSYRVVKSRTNQTDSVFTLIKKVAAASREKRSLLSLPCAASHARQESHGLRSATVLYYYTRISFESERPRLTI